MPLTLEILRSNYREDMLEIMAEYGVRDARVFGSVVRGDATENSDVDIIVTLTKPLGLQFIALQNELSDLLGRRVDLLTDDAISAHFAPYIERDVVPL